MIQITTTEIVTSTVMYLIVHSLIWCLGNMERVAYAILKGDRSKIIHAHVKERHPYKLGECIVKDCPRLTTQYQKG